VRGLNILNYTVVCLISLLADYIYSAASIPHNHSTIKNLATTNNLNSTITDLSVNDDIGPINNDDVYRRAGVPPDLSPPPTRPSLHNQILTATNIGICATREESDCIICLGSFKVGQTVTVLTHCNHFPLQFLRVGSSVRSESSHWSCICPILPDVLREISLFRHCSQLVFPTDENSRSASRARPPVFLQPSLLTRALLPSPVAALSPSAAKQIEPAASTPHLRQPSSTPLTTPTPYDHDQMRCCQLRQVVLHVAGQGS